MILAEELSLAALDARFGLGKMTSPGDALWVTIDVDAGQITTATILVCQNVRWTVEVNDTTYTGHFC